MAFFKSFQTNPSSVNISSILDSVTSRVDDLANAVSDATYAVSDQLTEQVTTIINKVDEGDNTGSQGGGQTAAGQENKSRNNSIWQMARDSETSNTVVKTNQASDTAEAESNASQLEWEWRDGCWRVKKTEAELAEEEMKKQEEKEQQERKEQRRRERREKQLEKEGKLEKNREESQNGEQVDEPGDNGAPDRKASDSGDQSTAQQRR
ncbi:hypothetical protein D5F01_LYC14632 [Larimichthys crocea]|uniref:Uncharacterized protein n=1 Tax=Larimichthys crocea TaxID=215358 RepID=A0A6G0I581_LARCR|nr:hypothetical protein D5F01_LYC14632 [Larimichthys crocea]